MPRTPPAQLQRSADLISARPAVQVFVEYDHDFRRAHPDAEEFITRAFDRVNFEWRRYRREWLDIADIRLTDTGVERDASHVLARFLLSTASARSSIHVQIVGRQLEVYSNRRTATAVGGLAFRGSDVLVVSAPGYVGEERLAFYLFHEIGHLWEAYDLPFAGGDTTYGQRSHSTFVVDAGNGQILDESIGPAPRDTPNRAPAIIARRLAMARKVTRDPLLLMRLQDILLHEATQSNPAWMRKKRALFAATTDRDIRQLILDHETTPRKAREESEVRRQLAAHYWSANDALARADRKSAERELAEIRMIQLQEGNAKLRILIGAVERKIRKRPR